MIGLAAGGGFAVNVVGAPVAVCCPDGCPNELAANGAPGSGGRPPRPPAMNELPGWPPRAAQASRNWLLASRKVSGRITRLPATSVFGAVMVMVPLNPSPEDAWITLSGCQATRKWAPFGDNTDSAESSILLDRRGRRGASTAWKTHVS
jgi:hypothetical protein